MGVVDFEVELPGSGGLLVFDAGPHGGGEVGELGADVVVLDSWRGFGTCLEIDKLGWTSNSQKIITHIMYMWYWFD